MCQPVTATYLPMDWQIPHTPGTVWLCVCVCVSVLVLLCHCVCVCNRIHRNRIKSHSLRVTDELLINGLLHTFVMINEFDTHLLWIFVCCCCRCRCCFVAYIQILSLAVRLFPIPLHHQPQRQHGEYVRNVPYVDTSRNAHKILFNMSLKTETLLDYKRKLTTNRFRICGGVLGRVCRAVVWHNDNNDKWCHAIK